MSQEAGQLVRRAMPPAQPDPQQMAQKIQAEFVDLASHIDALAKALPPFQAGAQQIKAILNDEMMKAIGQLQQGESPTPGAQSPH